MSSSTLLWTAINLLVTTISVTFLARLIVVTIFWKGKR